jgi:hypothetical protein
MHEPAVKRDEQGWFAPGTKPGPGYPKGRPRTPPEKTKRARRASIVDQARRIEDILAPEVPAILAQLAQAAADGDVAAARIALSYVASPAGQRTRLDVPDLAAMPPELRLPEISARVATGELALEHGQALATLAKAEIESAWIVPMKRLLAEFKVGRLTVAGVGERLMALAAVIEGEVVEE